LAGCPEGATVIPDFPDDSDLLAQIHRLETELDDEYARRIELGDRIDLLELTLRNVKETLLRVLEFLDATQDGQQNDQYFPE
jgi:hypothetical protein